MNLKLIQFIARACNKKTGIAFMDVTLIHVV